MASGFSRARLAGVPGEAIDSLLARYGNNPHALVQILRETQAQHGWLPRTVLADVAGALGLTLAHVEGVATFYRFFHTRPVGEYRVLFSDNITDRMLGNVSLLTDLCERLGVERGKTRADGRASVDFCSCTGLCDQGPSLLINHHQVVTRLDAGRVHEHTETALRAASGAETRPNRHESWRGRATVDAAHRGTLRTRFRQRIFAARKRWRAASGAAVNAGVPIVTGDAKVVEQGKGDGVFICTTGVGVLSEGPSVGGECARTGDAVLPSGTISDHGIAVLSLRESLEFESTIESDMAALHTLVVAVLAAVLAGAIHVFRDPTRCGLATTLNEIARQSGVGMMLQESAIPILPQVEAACELPGLDPLYIANEGKLVAIVAQDAAPALLQAMKAHPLGKAATCIGCVTEDVNRFIQMNTSVGGQRVVDWLSGEPLPRIC